MNEIVKEVSKIVVNKKTMELILKNGGDFGAAVKKVLPGTAAIGVFITSGLTVAMAATEMGKEKSNE